MTLPIGVSVPHGGLVVPEEVKDICVLRPDDIRQDSDEGAWEIYNLGGEVSSYHRALVARAIVDVNRAPDDFRPDGVVKTETSYERQVWSRELRPPEIAELIERYHYPYHAALASSEDVVLFVDCHTMAEVGPPIGPGPGIPRPAVCLSDGDGQTSPPGWMDALRVCFEDAFETEVAVNDPFKGGYITLTHGAKSPWVQLELSREASTSLDEKRTRVLESLTAFVRERP